MNPNKQLWEKGDFTKIAESMRESGAALVAQLGITKGLKVLDLGCGDGTTAIPEAKLGAEVMGVDISGYLVEAAKKRAKAEGSGKVWGNDGIKKTRDATFRAKRTVRLVVESGI